jgi:hypothetical protein
MGHLEGNLRPSYIWDARFLKVKVCGASVVKDSQFREVANLTAFLLQSPDCSYYINKQILAPPLLRSQQHTDPRAHDFAHSPDL